MPRARRAPDRNDSKGTAAVLDLIRTFLVTCVVCVLPGYFWAKTLWPTNDAGEGSGGRLVFAGALSLALVPAISLAQARIFDTGVTLAVAAVSVAFVFLTGLGVYLGVGIAKGPEGSVSLEPPRLGAPTLGLFTLALALVLAGDLLNLPAFWSAVTCWGWVTPSCETAAPAYRFMIPVAVLVFSSGAVYLFGSYGIKRRSSEKVAPEERVSERRGAGFSGAPEGWRRLLLPAVLILTLARAYSGVVVFDWPFIRGVDHYSHAVMADRMMSVGHIRPYLIYPPGLHTTVAEISRISGLDPLRIFPVLGPALLVLPALSCYVLAKKVWGWPVGVAAAFLAGLVIGGPYYYFDDSMYPNLVTSMFLLVLMVAALVALYAAPSWRTGLLVSLLGSSVVLFHQVSSLYLALLLALISIFILPYLLLKDRRRGVVLFLSFALMVVIAIPYGLDTYGVPKVIASALGLSSKGATSSAVHSAIGTQQPFWPSYLFGTVVSQPVTWLAMLGAVVALGSMWGSSGGRSGSPRRLVYLTLGFWALVIFSGSLTTLSGFPQRFGRDLGVPLAIFAAFALVALIRSLPGCRRSFTGGLAGRPDGRRGRRFALAYAAASVAVLLVGVLTGLRVAQGAEQAYLPSWRMTMTPGIAAAGAWLSEHNTGGNIMVSPQVNQVPSRMMLAMGHYSALQSFAPFNIELNRDLPPTGKKPVYDVLSVMNHPQSEEAARLLKEHDVRYIVLYKYMPDRPIIPYWQAFAAHPELYRTTFENNDVLIVAPRAPFLASATGSQ